MEGGWVDLMARRVEKAKAWGGDVGSRGRGERVFKKVLVCGGRGGGGADRSTLSETGCGSLMLSIVEAPRWCDIFGCCVTGNLSPSCYKFHSEIHYSCKKLLGEERRLD